jgi:hypothetical protein
MGQDHIFGEGGVLSIIKSSKTDPSVILQDLSGVGLKSYESFHSSLTGG